MWIALWTHNIIYLLPIKYNLRCRHIYLIQDWLPQVSPQNIFFPLLIRNIITEYPFKISFARISSTGNDPNNDAQQNEVQPWNFRFENHSVTSLRGRIKPSESFPPRHTIGKQKQVRRQKLPRQSWVPVPKQTHSTKTNQQKLPKQSWVPTKQTHSTKVDPTPRVHIKQKTRSTKSKPISWGAKHNFARAKPISWGAKPHSAKAKPISWGAKPHSAKGKPVFSGGKPHSAKTKPTSWGAKPHSVKANPQYQAPTKPYHESNQKDSIFFSIFKFVLLLL